jgi:hypothetical protein
MIKDSESGECLYIALSAPIGRWRYFDPYSKDDQLIREYAKNIISLSSWSVILCSVQQDVVGWLRKG